MKTPIETLKERLKEIAHTFKHNRGWAESEKLDEEAKDIEKAIIKLSQKDPEGCESHHVYLGSRDIEDGSQWVCAHKFIDDKDQIYEIFQDRDGEEEIREQ